MDDRQFDDLSRSLTAASRRSVLAALASGTFGLVSLAISAEEAAGKKGKGKKKKKKRGGQSSPPSPPPPLSCPSGYSPCGGQCIDLTDHPQHCGACATVCSPGKECCGGVCANRLDDDNHCGTCGSRCLPNPSSERPQGAICVSGTCQPCTLAGSLPPEGFNRCCRDLIPCQSPTGQGECIPAGAPCNV
jgi:Stigma-specific protein, Stig1